VGVRTRKEGKSEKGKKGKENEKKRSYGKKGRYNENQDKK
jgi:hypothetical protein